MRNYSDKLYIDGVDAFDTYGVFVAEGEYAEVVEFPKFKTVESTEWPEEDGEEYDLLDPAFDSRNIDIEFYFTSKTGASDLFAALSEGESYHTFYFVDLERTYTWRMSKTSSLSLNVRMGKFKLTFVEDYCSTPSGTPYELGETEVWEQGYTIDGYDFSQFGVWVLEDTDASLLTPPKVRANLEVDNKYVSGIVYDDTETIFESDTVTVTALINCDGYDEFRTRWDALFSVVLQPEERTLTADSNVAGQEITCFYQQVTVKKFKEIRGRIWCQFEIKFTTTDYRPAEGFVYLIAEDGTYLTTEDGYLMITKY